MTITSEMQMVSFTKLFDNQTITITYKFPRDSDVNNDLIYPEHPLHRNSLAHH